MLSRFLLRCLYLSILLMGMPSLAFSGVADVAILPPELPWDGASQDLIVEMDDPWITPAEKSGFESTPTYEETVIWLERLVAAAPELEMVSLGQSALGRDIWLVIASAEQAFHASALQRTGKPTLLAQACIHAGEIDGKDAGLMLLRDLTVKGKLTGLLERVNLLFVPIFSVDGHERRSRFSRMNQRGPDIVGWRTTARNLNLNRDYAKVDTPAMRAMLAALNSWRPDLYVDLHVTDGADYQYDITWGASGPQAWSPNIGSFLRETLDPRLRTHLEAAGHIPGPLVFAANQRDMIGGMFDWSAANPRYSDGYGSARHLPTILVENHSLKPYKQRVLGTYVLLEGLLESLGNIGDELRQATAKDRASRPERVPLAWSVPQDVKPEQVEFLGVESVREPSEISNTEQVIWTGKKVEITIPKFSPTEVSVAADRPRAYWLSPVWSEVIDRLALHGIEMERLTKPREVDVEMYRLADVEYADAPFEGRIRVTASTQVEQHRLVFPAGSVRISTDQPLGNLAMVLLEPSAPDSFFQWGFFLEVLQRTEYFEGYVMEPMAQRMLEEDPELAVAFEKALAEDDALAANPRSRLEWFYRQTPFYDPQYLLYPVAREP